MALAEESRLALYEWSPAFVKSFVNRVDADLLEAAIDELARGGACSGLDGRLTRKAVHKLQGFLSKTDLSRDVVVECAEF